MRLFCLGDEETVRGFRLAGIDGQVVLSAEEASRALSGLVQQGGCGVLILTEKVSLAIAESVRRVRLRPGSPLLVEVAGPEGPQPGHRSLQQIAQEAVGIRIGDSELLP